MASFNLFPKPHDKGQTYRMPYSKRTVRYSHDAHEIADYFQTSYTRSRLIRTLLTNFNLSRNSIVTSEDDHALFLKRRMMRYFPAKDKYPELGQTICRLRIFLATH